MKDKFEYASHKVQDMLKGESIRPFCYYDSRLCQEAKNKDNYNWEAFEISRTGPLQRCCLISQFQTVLSYSRGVPFQVDKLAANSHAHTCPLIVHFQLISGGNQGWTAISPHSQHDKHNPPPAHPLSAKPQALSSAITTLHPSIESFPNPGQKQNVLHASTALGCSVVSSDVFQPAPVLLPWWKRTYISVNVCCLLLLWSAISERRNELQSTKEGSTENAIQCVNKFQRTHESRRDERGEGWVALSSSNKSTGVDAFVFWYTLVCCPQVIPQIHIVYNVLTSKELNERVLSRAGSRWFILLRGRACWTSNWSFY